MLITKIRNAMMPQKRKGFSLPELSIAILCMMILATVLYLSYDWIRDSAKRSTTISDMDSLQNACRMYMGHRKDGAAPATLGALITGLTAAESSDGVAKGNYIKKSDWTAADASTWVDGWGNAYTYTAATRTITSTGNGTQITVTF